jgi:hypothetical protein
LTDIELNGGDCTEWTYYYGSLAQSIGFKVQDVSIYPDERSAGHRFLIMWDKNLTGYCLMDQLNVNCWEMAK